MRQGEIMGLTWDCIDFRKGIEGSKMDHRKAASVSDAALMARWNAAMYDKPKREATEK